MITPNPSGPAQECQGRSPIISSNQKPSMSEIKVRATTQMGARRVMNRIMKTHRSTKNHSQTTNACQSRPHQSLTALTVSDSTPQADQANVKPMSTKANIKRKCVDSGVEIKLVVMASNASLLMESRSFRPRLLRIPITKPKSVLPSMKTVFALMVSVANSSTTKEKLRKLTIKRTTKNC